MTSSWRPRLRFIVLSVGVFIGGHIGTDALARVLSGESGLVAAARDAILSATGQPAGTLIQFLPFIAFRWLASFISRRKSMHIGWVLFLIPSCVLSLVSFYGHLAAQQALQSQRWTAAALTIGLLPVLGLVVVLLALVASVIVAKDRDRSML